WRTSTDEANHRPPTSNLQPPTSDLMPLPVTGGHGPAVLEIDLDEFLARRNPRHDLLGPRLDDDPAVWIRVTPVDAESEPAGMRSRLRLLEDRNAGDLLRRPRRDVEDVDVAVDAVHHPDLFLIRCEV